MMTGLITDAESGDLIVAGGELAIGDTRSQTAAAVVMSQRGEIKSRPLLGGDAGRQLGGCVDVMWAGIVRGMLRECGVECERITVAEGGQIEIR